MGFGIDKFYSLGELLQLGIPLFNAEGSYKLFEIDWRYILHLLLNENMYLFINLDTRQANFLDGEFTGLLKSVRDYAEQGYIPQGFIGQRSMEEQIQDSLATPTGRTYFKRNGNYSLINQVIRQFPTAMSIMGSQSYFNIDTDDEIAGIQAIAEGLVPFTYWQGFGINSQSENKAVAWAFIKYLLSYEIQVSNLWGIGLCINNEARAERAEINLFGAMLDDTGIAFGSQERQYLNEFLEEYKATVEKLSDSINTLIVKDTSLNDMIQPELRYFFDGTRSADEIARVLQNRTTLYLSE
jgi:ABC-type glycerol-3-phosphate transport system substrate-binding protein